MTATAVPEMTTTALCNWFGSNRTLAATVGTQLGKLEWCGVPFVGGCCELPYIKTRDGIACDLHRHLINLANVVRDPALKDELARRLDLTLFHPDTLQQAQDRCRTREQGIELSLAGSLYSTASAVVPTAPDVDWAYDYFICSWMAPGGRGGADDEFNQSMSFRWTSTGGGSCTRFRSASDSLDAWCASFRPWVFQVMDAFDFLEKFNDRARHGLYTDPPWVDAGDVYKHPFTERHHRDLARRLAAVSSARVVVRYGDHPLIREIYPAPKWNWIEQTSRAQSNNAVKEVLIVNGKSAAAR